MRRSAQRAGGGLIAGALLVALGCGDRGPRDEPGQVAEAPEAEEVDPEVVARLPEGVTLDQVREGQRNFTVCVVCHGPDGRGTQLGPSLRDGQWIHIDGEPAQIEQIIRTGVAEPEQHPVPMPVMGGGDFTEEQLRALALYVYALARTGS
jgi:mono/diheme cytochrome c family protein